MADTQYEHAGNADQRRDIQLDKSARCNLCHFAQGTELSSETVELQRVVLPGNTPALFCQLCIKLCKQVGDDKYERAAIMLRPLPAINQEANDELLKNYENDTRTN